MKSKMGYRCPQCKSEKGFTVEARVFGCDIEIASNGEVTDTQMASDLRWQWDGSDRMSCAECGHEDTEDEFDKEEQEFAASVESEMETQSREEQQ